MTPTGLALFVATNDEPRPQGSLARRDNVFAVDLATLRTVRLTRNQLAHGVAVAGGRLYVSTGRGNGTDADRGQETPRGPSFGQGGDVAVTDSDDPAAAARALERARPDLRRLDTPPDWERVARGPLPNFVSDVEHSPAGPWAAIDANDTDRVLLRRIPAILRRHLAAEGVRRAVISFPEAPRLGPEG